MGSRAIKFERAVNPEDAAIFFKALANSIETGSTELEDYGIDLAAAKKVKIGIEKEGEIYTLKIKAKYPDLPAAEVVMSSPSLGSGKPPYKYLKKRMKALFKSIGQSLLSGQLPKENDVAQFLDDSELMVTYPGRGDEFYEKYTQTCREFSEAYEKGDHEALNSSYAFLTQYKKECHARYK